MDKLDLNSVKIIKTESVPSSKGTFVYRSWGEGPTLVCLPGWPASSLATAAFAELLKDSFRIVALDFPGWSNAKKGTWNMQTLDDYAEVVEEFIRTLKIQKFLLLGYSFGGVVAQSVSNRKKVKPEALVLVSTFRGWERFSRDPMFRPGLELYDLAIQFGIRKDYIRDGIKSVYGGYLRTRPYYSDIKDIKILKAVAEESLSGDGEVLLHAGTCLRGQDVLAQPVNGMKSLVIYGDDDLGFVKRDSIEIAESLKVEPTVLAGCDHFHFFVRPDKCAPHVKKVLSS